MKSCGTFCCFKKHFGKEFNCAEYKDVQIKSNLTGKTCLTLVKEILFFFQKTGWKRKEKYQALPFLLLSISQKVWKAEKKCCLSDRRHEVERIPDGNIGAIYSTYGSNWKMSFQKGRGWAMLYGTQTEFSLSSTAEISWGLCVNRERRKKKGEENSLYN